MTKLFAGIILALILISGILGYTVRRQAVEVAALKSQREALSKTLNQAAERLKRDRQALVAREAANAAQTRKLAQTQEALSKALQRNKTWSDTDVPTDVQESLTGRSDGPAGNSERVLNPASSGAGTGTT